MKWVSSGAWLAAIAVVMGAFGAHSLRGSLDVRGLELWETAARYLFYAGLSLTVVGITAHVREDGPRFRVAGWALLAGGVVFSGTVAALALGGPSWLGAVTPLGGAAMIGGLGLLGLRSAR